MPLKDKWEELKAALSQLEERIDSHLRQDEEIAQEMDTEIGKVKKLIEKLSSTPKKS